MSAFTNGNSSSRAVRRSASVLDTIILRSLNSGCSRALAVEHVLDAEEADALGAELARPVRVLGRVGVGADLQAAELVADLHEVLQHRVGFAGVTSMGISPL